MLFVMQVLRYKECSPSLTVGEQIQTILNLDDNDSGPLQVDFEESGSSLGM